VSDISQDTEGIFITVADIQIRGDKIFDSRTPSYNILQNGVSHIYQSFVGWMIETKDENINPEAFRFMDFDIDQLDFTQFVYVLPFSKTRALVEVTRFGSQVIITAQAEEILEKYITKSYGSFKKLDIEI
jgi:lycopene beta-cyclase